MEPPIDTAHMHCIKLCWQCRSACQSMLYHHLFDEGIEHIDVATIRLFSDCIQICQTAADFMYRNSPFHLKTCNACAEVCTQCAYACKAMSSLPVAQQCAAMCQTCAETCRKMSQ